MLLRAGRMRDPHDQSLVAARLSADSRLSDGPRQPSQGTRRRAPRASLACETCRTRKTKVCASKFDASTSTSSLQVARELLIVYRPNVQL